MNLKHPNLWIMISGIVAVIALVLSQFPPIRQMVRGTDIRITAPETISLWHDLGNIHTGVTIDVYNAGGYTVNISKIECAILEKDTSKVFTLPARTYFGENYALSLSPFTLSPDQHWTHDVTCVSPFTRSELEQVNDLKARIHTNIIEKGDKIPVEARANNRIEIDDNLYREAVNFFNKKFELTREGNYQFFIKAVSESGEVLKVQGFDFTLFRSNIQELRKVTEKDYKQGAGVEFPSRYVRGERGCQMNCVNEFPSSEGTRPSKMMEKAFIA